jgi:hypothetical protein
VQEPIQPIFGGAFRRGEPDACGDRHGVNGAKRLRRVRFAWDCGVQATTNRATTFPVRADDKLESLRTDAGP